MIRAILRLVEWLDQKFPAKVVVCEADYRMLAERQIDAFAMFAKLESHVEDLRQGFVGRWNQHEDSITALKEAMVKAPIEAAINRRAEFIAQGRTAE